VGATGQALLLEIPEVVVAERLTLRASRRDDDGELADACMFARTF
jgi:hypothetical protein